MFITLAIILFIVSGNLKIKRDEVDKIPIGNNEGFYKNDDAFLKLYKRLMR